MLRRAREVRGVLDLRQGVHPIAGLDSVVPPCSHTVPEVPARRWRVLLLLGGWVLATGAHWDVIQVVAWGRMWLENVQTRSAFDALARTFSPEGMCQVCHSVQAAKHARQENPAVPASVLDKAPLLIQAGTRVVVAAPDVAFWLSGAAALMPEPRTTRPPRPVPRAA